MISDSIYSEVWRVRLRPALRGTPWTALSLPLQLCDIRVHWFCNGELPEGRRASLCSLTDCPQSSCTDNFDGNQSPWESISPLEGPPPYFDYIWPVEYPPTPTRLLATLLPLPQDHWSLDGSFYDFESVDISSIFLEDSTSTGLGLSFSSDTVTPIPQPTEATNSTPTIQTLVETEKPMPLDLESVPEGDPPVGLDQLCAILRTHYPNRKPPGQLFKQFICRKKDLNQCMLCPKALENREQMNQHVMKVHCNHLPFGCDEPGW